MTRTRMPSVALLGVGLLAAALAIPAGTSAAASLPARAGAPAAALPALAPGDWTGFRNKAAGGGVNQAETAITVANVAGLHLTRAVPSFVNATGGQAGATGHGLLYYGAPGGGIVAADEATGAVRWSAATGSPLITVGDTAVYTVAGGITGGGNGVVAYNPATGAQLWRKTLTGVTYVAPPTLTGNQLLVPWTNTGGPNGRSLVTSYNATTGAKQWQTKLPGHDVPGAVSAGTDRGALTLEDNVLQTFDLKTGALRWSVSVPGGGGGFVQARPVVRGNRVYVGLVSPGAGSLQARDLTTGAALWTRALPGPLFFGLVENAGMLYVVSEADADGQDDLYALNEDTGATVWSKATGADGSPTLANGVLFVPRFGASFGFTTVNAATGALVGSVTTDSFPFSEPMVSHGRVYLLEQDGDLDVFAP